MIGETVECRSGAYRVERLLGRGKSGYSYLANGDRGRVVLKAMHDEPCPYYQFSDKLGAELDAYAVLREIGIPLPRLLDNDPERRLLIKEYVEGPTASRLIADGGLLDSHIASLFDMARRARKAELNLDYFPANFVASGGTLAYIDYERNPYSEEWSLGNWGIFYWANRQGMKRFLETGDATAINADPARGIPVKAGLEAIVCDWTARHGFPHD